MPCTLQIVRTADFVKLDAQGHLDVKQSHDVLAAVAKRCVELEIDCALLDVRDLEGGLKIEDMHTLAKAFHEMGFRERHRLTVLHSYNAGEHATMFAMFASDRGWNVRAFVEFEEAIEWFSKRAARLTRDAAESFHFEEPPTE
jgi:extradiol dioxygenase family protein